MNDNGKFIGAIFYDVSLAGLADVVNKVQLFDAGYVFIVAGDGTPIAHPQTDLNGKPMKDFLGDAGIQDDPQQVSIDGKDYTLDFSKVPGEDWYIGVVLDEEIAYQSLADLRNSSIIYTVVALAISIVILLVLMAALMRPLGTLNAAIQDVASGEGDLTQRLDTSTDQEFSSLAENFNTFTSTLQQQITQSKAIGEEILRGSEMTSMGLQLSLIHI